MISLNGQNRMKQLSVSPSDIPSESGYSAASTQGMDTPYRSPNAAIS
jgi:hypothetical protein